MSEVYTSKVLEVLENGDAIIDLPEELCKKMNWNPGDVLDMKVKNGAIHLTKIKEGKKMQYECEVCGHIHDETTMGKLEDLPKFSNCPECGSDAREVYKPVEF